MVANSTSTSLAGSRTTVLVRSAPRLRSMWSGAATTKPHEAMPRTSAEASNRYDPKPWENRTSGNGPSAEPGTSR